MNIENAPTQEYYTLASQQRNPLFMLNAAHYNTTQMQLKSQVAT